MSESTEANDLRRIYADVTGSAPLFLSCPFHDDSTASFAVYPDHCYCFGCAKWEGRIHHLQRIGLDSVPDKPIEEYRRTVIRHSRPSRPPIQTPQDFETAVRRYERKLWADESFLDYLFGRGLKPDCIQHARLGHSGLAYTIPILDTEGSIQTIRFRKDARFARPQTPKYWGTAGFNESVVYAPYGVAEHTYLCEGEFDCLILNQIGFRAITLTNGVNADLKPLENLITSKNIREFTNIVDNDSPGLAGGVRLVRMQRGLGCKTKTVSFFEKDITDAWLRRPEYLLKRLGRSTTLN